MILTESNTNMLKFTSRPRGIAGALDRSPLAEHAGAVQQPVQMIELARQASGQIEEIFNMTRGIVRKKAEFDVPQRCRDHGLRVFLLKL